MSSQQPFSGPAVGCLGEVHQVQDLSDQLAKLCLSDDYSDITLVVGSQRLPAHKVILAARSEYFRALLFGGMKESSQQEIELMDTPPEAFKILLKYVYAGHIVLSGCREDLILEILGLAHQYVFPTLESAVSDYLKAVFSVRTVCLVYDTAALYHLSNLSEAALEFMDGHAVEILVQESFLGLSEAAVRTVISRDSFCADEVDIFRAVARWAQANPEQEVRGILGEIRLSLLSITDILRVVRPTELMPAELLLDAIQSRTDCNDTQLRYRGFKRPEENVALPKLGASVLQGEVKSALLDGDSKNYDMERGFSRHPIDEAGDKGIVVMLGMPCIINRINMLLWDRDQRAYSYYIETSMNQEDWVRIVDHSKYHCRSWQFLYFPDRVVKYIRVVGTHNTVNKVFHVVTLEALYTMSVYQLDMGLIVPSSNVATLDHSALVIEGVCRSRNALLNGDTSNYDWDSGYTCHQLGSGAIVVQLGQPYALDSLRMLLWDCDDRSYSYYIEVSTNQKNWEVVCDRTREACRSWQVITFTRRPVVFIRIVGTHNTANEVFHCVHFEAPAMVNLQGVRVSPGPRCSRSTSRSSGGDDDRRAASGSASDSSEDLPPPPYLSPEVLRALDQARLADQDQAQQQQQDALQFPLGAAALPHLGAVPALALGAPAPQPAPQGLAPPPAAAGLAGGGGGHMQGLAPGQVVARGQLGGHGAAGAGGGARASRGSATTRRASSNQPPLLP